MVTINNYQKDKRFKELQSANTLRKSETVLRDGSFSSINSTDLLVGDIVRIQENAIIPADGIVVKSKKLMVNEFIINGDDENVSKETNDFCLKKLNKLLKKQEIPKDHDAKKLLPSSVVLAGSSVTKGHGLILIIAVGKNSKEGRILNLALKHAEQTPLERKLGALSDKIAIYGLISATIITSALFLRFFVELSTGVKI